MCELLFSLTRYFSHYALLLDRCPTPSKTNKTHTNENMHPEMSSNNIFFGKQEEEEEEDYYSSMLLFIYTARSYQDT